MTKRTWGQYQQQRLQQQQKQQKQQHLQQQQFKKNHHHNTCIAGWIGLNWIELDRIGSDWIRSDRIGTKKKKIITIISTATMMTRMI